VGIGPGNRDRRGAAQRGYRRRGAGTPVRFSGEPCRSPLPANDRSRHPLAPSGQRRAAGTPPRSDARVMQPPCHRGIPRDAGRWPPGSSCHFKAFGVRAVPCPGRPRHRDAPKGMALTQRMRALLLTLAPHLGPSLRPLAEAPAGSHGTEPGASAPAVAAGWRPGAGPRESGGRLPVDPVPSPDSTTKDAGNDSLARGCSHR